LSLFFSFQTKGTTNEGGTSVIKHLFKAIDLPIPILSPKPVKNTKGREKKDAKIHFLSTKLFYVKEQNGFSICEKMSYKNESHS